MRNVGKSLGIGLVGSLERASGINIQRRAETIGKRVQGHVFNMEAALESMQGIQWVGRCGAGGFCGRYRSPLEPQAVRPSPHRIRDTIYMVRNFMREMLARDIMTRTESSEAEFNQAAGTTLARIEQVLEDADLDFETPADGIIEVEFDDGSKIIINRHGVAREIWVAARSGGFHFKPQDAGWVDTRSGEPLYDKLAALIAAQGGVMVRF
jgi:CyaY protein